VQLSMCVVRTIAPIAKSHEWGRPPEKALYMVQLVDV